MAFGGPIGRVDVWGGMALVVGGCLCLSGNVWVDVGHVGYGRDMPKRC